MCSSGAPVRTPVCASTPPWQSWLTTLSKLPMQPEARALTVFFPGLTPNSLERRQGSNSGPGNFLQKTGCMAKHQEKEAQHGRQEGRKEGGGSFTEAHILTPGNGVAGGSGRSILEPTE